MPRSNFISSLRRRTGINFGKCVDFNQATSTISYTTPAALQIASGDYSYLQYFNARTITAVAARLMDQANQGLLVIITTNGIQVQARHASVNGLVVVPISYVTTGEWHDLVVNWSDTMNYPEVWFDGQLFVTNTANKSGARLAAGTPTYVGNRAAADRTFNGLLDKHAMFSRVMAQAEVQAFHQSGLFPSGALVAYEMDETSGSLTDASGNAVSGTPSNVSQNVSSLVVPARSLVNRSLAGARSVV